MNDKRCDLYGPATKQGKVFLLLWTVKLFKLWPVFRFIFLSGTESLGIFIKNKITRFSKRLEGMLGFSKTEINGFIKEIQNEKNFYEDLKNKIVLAEKAGYTGGGITCYETEAIYALIRSKKPEIVIETGVGPGMSSAFILKAIQRNGHGKLYSIDLPGFDKQYYPKIGKHFDTHVPDHWNVGWAVPSELKPFWELIIGDSKIELPKLVAWLTKVDVFLHDSLHTWDHMMFEYAQVWPYLSGGGILMSHDTKRAWSLAFCDFCKEKRIPYVIISSLGIAKKV